MNNQDWRVKQQDMTELNGDGNRDRGRYGEDEPKKISMKILNQTRRLKGKSNG